MAVAFALLCALTLLVPDWIEVVFGVDPDSGNGAIEAVICVATGMAAAVLSVAAVRTRRQVAHGS